MWKSLLGFSVYLPSLGYLRPSSLCCSKPQPWTELWSLGRNHTCVCVCVFHEGQARLQLLVPPLPTLGCAAFSVPEEETASWPGLLGTFQASETLALGPKDVQTGLGICAVAPSTWLCIDLLWNGITQTRTQDPLRTTRLVTAPDCSSPK